MPKTFIFIIFFASNCCSTYTNYHQLFRNNTQVKLTVDHNHQTIPVINSLIINVVNELYNANSIFLDVTVKSSKYISQKQRRTGCATLMCNWTNSHLSLSTASVSVVAAASLDEHCHFGLFAILMYSRKQIRATDVPLSYVTAGNMIEFSNFSIETQIFQYGHRLKKAWFL